MNTDLSNLFLLSDAETRSITAENPRGKKGGGGRAEPEEDNPASELGIGWKARPCIRLKSKSTTTLMDIENSGIIQHIWMTVDTKAYRDCILRFYWDHEENPSVEVPLGDFFANCHGLRYDVNSLPVVVNPSGGFNCYWPMPFSENAKVTLENQSEEDIENFFYQFDYALADPSKKAARFHAQWRRSMTERENPLHVILDDLKGQGHYVGTVIGWNQFSDGWWGEGEVKFYIDGDDFPTICGTGTEDYFGGAWAFNGRTYSTPFLGYPLRRNEESEIPKHGLYRWHVMDPIRFKKDLKVTIQALGWWPDGKFEPLTDDISSVAYWYQEEPHKKFPDFPERKERWSRASHSSE